MGKYANAKKKYNPQWEKEPQFLGWLQRTPEALLKQGLPEAFCKVCRSTHRPHKSDLVNHSTSQKHKTAMNALPQPINPQSKQSTLFSHGFRIKSAESKIMDLKLAGHIACHSSVKTIDHLGEILKDIGKGSQLEDLKLHRTKCSKIICKVLSPSMLKELLEDIGDSWYSIILDESTDTTAVKHLALVVKYFSFQKMRMITDFLGLVETPQATAEVLYQEFKKFMHKMGLPLNRLLALGTDGAFNLCGSANSLFAYLKRKDCPNLHLVKCICHGLDHCASKASKVLPETLEFLLRESRNWFAHSALRKMQYSELFKALNDGKSPPELVKLALTRWLVWYFAVKAHVDQYEPLRTLFKRVAADKNNHCLMANTLAALHDDKSHLLFLIFLKPILKEVVSMNSVLQSSVADVSKVYTDLRMFVLSLANRVVKPEAMKESQPGMIRKTELQALQAALSKNENFKALDLINYGENFWKVAFDLKLPDEKFRDVKTQCAEFLVKLLHELCLRLPSCIEAVEKLRAFTPKTALGGKGRPDFKDLPLDMIRDSYLDFEDMESQWIKLATLSFSDVCSDVSDNIDVESVDIIVFWANVWELKNGAGNRVFKDLARFVLSCLSLPLSNAVVERLFSTLTIVKSRLRNKLSLEMLEALLRVRTHFQANGICCTSFTPTQEMVDNFNYKNLYGQKRRRVEGRELPAHQHGPDEDEQDVDDPLNEAVGIQIGLTEDDGDIDQISNVNPVAEWDEMLDLLAEVDSIRTHQPL